MTAKMAPEREHGIIVSMPHERFGYFAWPTVARTSEGVLVVGASGLRFQHVCPWGKTVLFTSRDDGRTWSFPRVLNDTPMDDRDTGIVSLGGTRLLVSWFTSDACRGRRDRVKERLSPEMLEEWDKAFTYWSDEMVRKWDGSWIRLSDDGHAWSDMIRVSVNTSHGPILVSDGSVLYFGKGWHTHPGPGPMPAAIQNAGPIKAIRSTDGGRTWSDLGTVPNAPGVQNVNVGEPHVVETSSGRLVGLIRYHGPDPSLMFTMFQTESDDGGRTWTPMHHTGVYGSPPHLIRHSSGALVCVYGYRKEPFGIRAMISRDDGKTWDSDWILRDDGLVRDLGYPASVEMPDGSLFTVYYQTPGPDQKCAIQRTRWRLPV